MTLIIFFIFANISLLIPGYSFLSHTKIKTSHLLLPLSYAVNIAFFGLLSGVFYALKVPLLVIQLIFWLYFFSGVVLFVISKDYKQLLKNRFILLCLLAMTAMSLAFISLSFTGAQKFIPDPEALSNRNYDAYNVKVLNVAQTNANDNSVPYRQAQFFVNRSDPAKDSFIEEWGVHFFQRTPLMGSVTSTLFIALDDKLPINYIWSSFSSDPYRTYEKFQILAHILNSIIIIPAFFLVTKLFNKKTAKLTVLFAVTSQFFIYNSFFSWPKTFVSFFILLSLLLIYEKKPIYTVLAGMSAGLAYLAHDLAVLYIGAIILLLLANKRFRDVFIYGAFWAIFAAPWVLISTLKYNKPSSFILYPLSTQGIPQPALRHEILKDFLSTPIWRLIQIRLESIYYLLSPYQLIYSEGGQEAGRRAWALGLFSIPGALGFGLVIPTIVGFFKNIKKWDIHIMIFVPVILSAVVMGWPKGLGAMHFAQASVILLIALASSWLVKSGNRLVILAVQVINYAQLVFFTVYSFGNSYRDWGNPKDVLALIVMNIIFFVSSFYIYKIVSDSSSYSSKS